MKPSTNFCEALYFFVFEPSRVHASAPLTLASTRASRNANRTMPESSEPLATATQNTIHLETPNPKPQTPNPKPQNPKPKSQTPNPEPQTPSTGVPERVPPARPRHRRQAAGVVSGLGVEEIEVLLSKKNSASTAPCTFRRTESHLYMGTSLIRNSTPP